MLLAASALATSVQTAHAIGPISVALSDLKAETVACPEGQRTMTLGARPYVVPPSALSCYTSLICRSQFLTPAPQHIAVRPLQLTRGAQHSSTLP